MRAMPALVVLSCLAGCPAGERFGLSPVEGDDDGADDDDSSEAPPSMTGDWDAYRVAIPHVQAEGRTKGGAASVMIQLWYTMGSDDVCMREIILDATYRYGAGQSDEYFAWVDETLELDAVSSVSDDCPEEWTIDADALLDEWRWVVHPLLFVSCDQVYATPELAEVFIGPDQVWAGDWVGEWTFETYCTHVGPAAAYFYKTGVIEGVWLVPARPEDVALMGAEFETFPPADPTHVEAWLVFGFVAADVANGGEPGIEGLHGSYTVIPAAPWIFHREDFR